MPENPGDKAQRLLDVALNLANVVREEDRDSIAKHLAGIDADDKDALILVLAGLVPVDVPMADLLRWVTWDEDGRPLTAQARNAIASHEYERRRKAGTPVGEMPAWVRDGHNATARERDRAKTRERKPSAA